MGEYDTQVFVNPQAGEFVEYGVAQRAVLNQEAFAEAKAEISSWPGSEPTPLIALDGLAKASGVEGVWCK